MPEDVQQECACEGCVCPVVPNEAVVREGTIYCSDACAAGHPQGKPCRDPACGCEAR